MSYNQYGASTDSFGVGQSDPFADTPYNAKEAAAPYSGRSNNAQAQHSAWMEGGKEPAKTGAWKKWATIGGLVVLVVAGVAGGIAAWKINSNSKSGGGNSSGSSASGSSNSNADKISNGADPSVFEKDARLKQSFYGMAYTVSTLRMPSFGADSSCDLSAKQPKDTIMPYCGGTQPEVTADIQLLSQVSSLAYAYPSAS
jgi:hypothetical protein